MKTTARIATAFLALLTISLAAQSPEPTPAFPGQTDAPAPARPSPPFNVETIATGLTGAWAVAFLPDGN
jgi:glucose/arabinose dehydrogenase